MSLIALASAKGAPGVTTTALALSWVWAGVTAERRVLVLDADVAGSGVLPSLVGGGVHDGGLLALAAHRTPTRGDALTGHALALDASGSRLLLTGVSDPGQARALTGLWAPLTRAAADLHHDGTDVIADVGRLGASYEPTPLLEHADLAVLVTGSDLVSLATARPAIRRLTAVRGPAATPVVVLVVAERRPYSAGEIHTALSTPVGAVLAFDPTTAAAVLSGGGGARFERSALIRTARAAATDLTARLTRTPVARMEGASA